jgi:PAS domain S-box-containing protein
MSYIGGTDAGGPNSDRIRVLHVDDERDVAELTAEFLERESDRIEVVTETSPADGADRLAAESIDCVVSDYEMSGTDGLAFLESIRDEYGDLPFLLFTGKGSEEIASEAISAGVTDYLQKETGTDQYTVLANRIENAVEQHRSRRAVEATEEKLLQLAERTDDILFMFDGDWSELLFVNSAYEDVWGQSIAELREDPESFLDAVHPEDRAKAQRSLDRLRDGEADAVEYRVRTGDDDCRWVRGETKPIFDDDGTLDRITGFVRDVTERKTRERELRARAEAMEAATDGIAILNEDAEFVFANDAHADVYGFDDPETLLGESWRVCYEDPSVERFEAEILPALTETGHWHGEMTVTAADGSTVHQELTLTRLEDGRIVCVVRDITARTERERELERYEALVRAVTDSISVVDETGTVEYENPAIEDLLGYEQSEIQGEHAFEYMHPEDRQRVMEQFFDLTAEDGETTERVEYRMRHADGSWRWLESEASNRNDPALDGYVITSRDVTERKARQRRLSEAQTVFDHAQDAIFLVDVDDGTFRVQRVNPAYEDLTGLSVEDLRGKTPREIVDEETAAEIEARYRECVERATPVEYDERIAFSGEPRHWHTKIAPVVEGGEVVKLVGATRDVTERVEREDRLAHQQSLLEAVIETSIDGVLVVNEDREYATWNQQFVDMWDMPPELVGDESEPAGLEWVRDQLEDPESFREQVEYLYDNSGEESRDRVRLTDGRVFDRYSAPVEGEDTYFGRVWFFRDVTDRVTYERELERQNERLDEFASIVSHDLRNPLNVATGRLELASEECDSEYLDDVERAHDRMASLIDDLLAFARAGSASMTTEAVDLAETCERRWDTVETGDATLVVDTAAVVRADENRLGELFENLFGNAVEHGSTSSLSQDSEEAVADENGLTVTVGELVDGFYVADDGLGIPLDEAEAVFDRGYSTAETGSGFGLPIVREIATAHGWDVSLTDSESGGARFEVTGVETLEK